MLQIVKENIHTGKGELLGSYTSKKSALSYAPTILDSALKRVGVTEIDARDERIGDFMVSDGKVAAIYGDFQIYLTKRMYDVWGKKVAEPSGTIRINGAAKWKDPDGGNILDVIVDEIVSLDEIHCHTANGDGSEIEATYAELKAA